MFNLSMTYTLDSDFHVPYGKIVKILPPPSDDKELSKLISDFGLANQHLAQKEERSSLTSLYLLALGTLLDVIQLQSLVSV